MIRRSLLASLALAGTFGLSFASGVMAQQAQQNAPAAAAAAASPTPAPTVSAADNSPIRIAICNPARIFQDMQETQDLRQSMEAEGKQFLDKKNEWDRKLKDLQAARDQLKPDSPQFAERNQELLKVATEYEVWGKLTQADVQRTQKARMRQLFDKIQAAVGEVAEQKGIDLVISEQKPEIPENLDSINVEQLRAILNGRNILYHTARVDISNDVIALLDSRYRAGQ